MTGPDYEFDDAALKGAVRRAFAGRTAPPALRSRVEALMVAGATAGTAAAVGQAVRATGRRWPDWLGSTPWKTMLAAACCFLAIGLAAVQVWSYFGPEPGRPTAPPTIFPVSVSAQLVAAHDNCAKRTDQLTTGADPMAVLSQLTSGKVTPSTPLTIPAGWQFKGGGFCTVGDTKAAHLLFSHGPQTISVFALPAPESCSHGTSALYRDTINGRAVEGFVHVGEVFGVVGSSTAGPMPTSDLDAMTAQVGTCVGAAGCSGLSHDPVTQ